MISPFRRSPGTVAVLGLATLLSYGCKPDKPPEYDGDAKSGPDGKRSGAVLMQVNSTVTDDVNYDNQDQTDWKQVQLTGKPGIFSAELHWDNAAADLNVDIFDSLGQQIGASPGPSPGQQTKKTVADIPAPGVYFVRVQAVKKGDFSVYTLATHWEGDALPDCPAGQMRDTATQQCVPLPAAEAKTPKEPKVHVHHDPVKPKERKFNPDNGVQGRILGAHREGTSLILHIDKGSSAGVKVGSKGTVLDGPAGSNPLEGGSFTITDVVDESKSVGKADLKSVGHNTRVSIDTR